jgi:hypothetical protein
MEDLTDMLEDVFEDDDHTQTSFRATLQALMEQEQDKTPTAGAESPRRAAANALLELAGLGHTVAEHDALEQERAAKEAAMRREEAALAEVAKLKSLEALQAPSEGVPTR